MVSGVGPGIHVLDAVHVPEEEGTVWEIFFGVCAPIGWNWQNVVFFAQKFIRLVREKKTVFPYGQDTLESAFHWLSEDTARFKIGVGVCRQRLRSADTRKVVP